MRTSTKIPQEIVRHLRVVRVIKQAVHPPSKREMNPRSLAYLKLLFMSKKNSLLFVSYPSSGWNWTVDIASFVLIKQFFGNFFSQYNDNAATLKQAEIKPFAFPCPADSRAAGHPRIRDQIPRLDIDYWFHSHGYWGESPLLGIDKAKTVIITRHFPTALYSHYTKRREQFNDFEEFMEKSGSIERMIRFYNSWHKFRKQYPQRFLQVSYEQFSTTPILSFGDLIEYAFGVEALPSIIEEALNFYEFQKQKKREYRFARDERKHFHFMGKQSYRDLIGEENYNNICYKLKNNLTSTFGYSLDSC